ncbi:MAG: hypothetical protein ACXVCX_15680 [Ktedonobacterales bacterium]
MTQRQTPLRLRWIVLAALAVDLALIGVRVALYTPLLAQPGSIVYIAEPVALLLAYAALVWWITANATAPRSIALTVGITSGLLSGVLWLVNHTVETFTTLSGSIGILATAPFLLGGFALWGVAAFHAARRADSLFHGVLAAVWSAMICVLITITFGFLLTYTSLPRLEHDLTADPDFLRSHWHDLHAFAIANSFDAAFSHLLGALIVATIVGSLGAFAGTLTARRNANNQ